MFSGGRIIRDEYAPRRGEGLVSLAGSLRWLEELRFRFDLAIEVLDRDLRYLLLAGAAGGQAVDMRAALGDRNDPALRDTAAAVFRSGKPRSCSVGGLRIRMFAVSTGETVPHGSGAVLLIGDALPAGLSGGPASETPTAELDRRLDSAGRWLVAAIEATTAAGGASDGWRVPERLASVVDVIEAVSQFEQERELIDLTVEAIGMWYDADVRAYRQGHDGDFVQAVSLAGAEAGRMPARLPGAAIWHRGDVFRLASARDVEELGWDPRAPETVFVPIAAAETPEWLLIVSGPSGESIDTTLSVLRRVVGLRLSVLHEHAAVRVRQKVGAALGLADAPAVAHVAMALGAIAGEIGASSAQLTSYSDGVRMAALSARWGRGEPAVSGLVEAGTLRSTPHHIVVGSAHGLGVTTVVEFHDASGGFSIAAVRLVEAGLEVLGSWISGVCVAVGGGEIRPAESPLDLRRRLAGELDRSGRIRTDGAVVVVLSDAAIGPDMREMVELVQRLVRPSDLVGAVAPAGAGVLLKEVASPVVAAFAERLRDAARRRGMTRVTVGSTWFEASSVDPDAAIDRAIENARRGANPS